MAGCQRIVVAKVCIVGGVKTLQIDVYQKDNQKKKKRLNVIRNRENRSVFVIQAEFRERRRLLRVGLRK